MLKATDDVWLKIEEVNRDINRMPYKTDLEMYKKLDFWSSKLADAGDCDDYACIKRRILREHFGPESYKSLRLATCWVEGKKGEKGKGGYHAVLTIDILVYNGKLKRWVKRTFVADNRYPMYLMAHNKLPYIFHKREQPGKEKWRLIINR